ncbi:MAG: NAD(P)H-binding protein [Chloroflexota bacterium]
MTRVLVTGGTGVLGREIVSRLLEKGYTVRIMSRSPRRGTINVEWAQAQMLAGEGLSEALQGVDVIVHAVTDTRLGKTDVEMTRHLLEKVKVTGVGYFLYISIVGTDKTQFAYHKIKVACEEMVRDSGIPYANLRFAQFHEFIDMILYTLTRLPIGFVPMDWKSQPMDAGEAADQVVRVVGEKPLGLLPDVAGPEVLTMKEMLREWQQARGSHTLVLPLPVLSSLSSASRRGLLTSPTAHVGKMTWAQWLERRYSHARQTGEKIGPVYSLRG